MTSSDVSSIEPVLTSTVQPAVVTAATLLDCQLWDKNQVPLFPLISSPTKIKQNEKEKEKEKKNTHPRESLRIP